MSRDSSKTRYELEAEAEELSDVLRRLDAVRGMVKESWAGDASKAFLSKLEDVTAEVENVKKMIDNLKLIRIE